MKVTLREDNVLHIEGETPLERAELRAWEAEFELGKSAFRIGESEAVERADEDVER